MPTFVDLTPKKKAALEDCVAGALSRCLGGYRREGGADVHSKRVVNQLASDGLVVVDAFETGVMITAEGRQFAQLVCGRAAA
jgi:hypothetical protein